MTANQSSAVMQQNHEPHDSLGDFQTPPWATRALMARIAPLGNQTVREPCANRGHMVRPLAEAFASVEAADIFDYGAGFAVADYLFGPDPAPVDWTITNPPFRLAQQIIERALRTSRAGVAMIVRSAFLEGQARHASLFKSQPPTDILQFTERVVMHKGRLAPEGSTATAYCWLVWNIGGMPWSGRGRTVFHWISPCRKLLERAGDYPASGIAVLADHGLRVVE